VDHNLVDPFMGTEGEVTGEAAVRGDPLFTDAAAGDFHLRAGSPALGAGLATGAALHDLDGRARTAVGPGAACDIGAYVH
jgi:hypothetical protein